MVISSTEAYMAAIGLGAIRGARVGWRREALTSTMVLGTVLFLSTGGDALLAHLFTGAASGGTVAQAAGLSGGTGGTSGTGGTVDATTTTSSCALSLQATISKVTFLVMSFLGYWVGRTQGQAPTLTHHRITGLIPGAINGAALTWYGTKSFFPGQDILISTPTAGDASSNLPFVFGAGLILMLVILFVGAQARKTYAAKK